MGKKKRSHPDIEELLARPWCFYCERDFEDLKLLISHQKAKHFKCDRCGRRLNTAGGLSVHLNQVHKETLSQVENAIQGRQGLDVEIFGMEGVPEDIIQQHNQRIIQNFYTAQADRRAETGNPPPGSGGQGPAKKIKVETAEELKKRLAEHKARRAANGGVLPPRDTQSPAQSNSPGAFNTPFAPPQPGFDYQQQYPGQGAPGAPGFPPAQYPGGFPSNGAPPAGYPASSLPTRPPGASAVAGALPQRPGYPGYPGGNASTLDDLVSGASRQGDDIDQIIRMAEAGIKPPKKEEAPAAAPAAEPTAPAKTKKEKATRMVFADGDFSLEEKMAQMARYAVAV